MANFSLTKSSSENDLKKYFTAVLELSKEDNKFPVNLDEVWMLVYSRRDNAIRELRNSFFEDEDFQVVENQSLPQNEERIWGGQNKVFYYLSLPCLEYFIARKVRPVFEVYRQVFHKVAETKIPSYQIDDRIKRAEAWIEEEKERQRLELENKELSEDLDESQKKVGYLRNEVANRKEMMKEQHQQILDLESRNIKLNRQKMRLEDKIATDSDKVKYYDHCHENGDKTLTNFTETAGLLGQKRTLLIDVLLFNGYLYRNRFGKLRAYAKYMDRYFVLKDGNENEYGYVPKNVYVTIEGRKFILENFRRFYKKYNNHINSIK